MLPLRSSALALLLAIFLSFQPTYAQQNNSTAEQSAEAAVREKAFKLLESLADQLGTLQSAENRARMGSNIAGSLWPHNEKRARALFKLVEDDIKLGLQQSEKDPDDRTLYVFLKLREDTIERIARRDPELALAFFESTLSTVKQIGQLSDGTLLPSIAEKERAFELQLAKRISAGNPQAAVKLARQSLANGFSNDLPALLRKISAKDKEQAQVLYKEIVARLRDANLADDWQALDFAQNLLMLYAPPEADEATHKELLNIFLTQATAKSCLKQASEGDQGSDFCQQMAALAPLIERFFPVQARRLKQWPSAYSLRTVPQLQASAELGYLSENGTLEDILAMASKNPEMEGQILLQAMWKAEIGGDLERATKIANSYNGDPEIRRVMDQRLKEYEKARTMGEDQFTELQNRLGSMPAEEQVQLLLTWAAGRAPYDKKATLKLLAQVNGIVETLKPGRQQTEFHVRLALLYAFAKSDRGFAIMESLMPKLNDLVAAGARLDGYETRYLREGEWNMSAEGTVGSLLTLLANRAGYFAWCDFDRAVALAGQFERSEIRMMAQLKLAQGILAGPPKDPRDSLPAY